MDQSLVYALIAATAVLVAIPGPNVALFVANTLRYGSRHGAITVLGTTIGVGVQLAAVVLGLALVLQLAGEALTWLKWIGVLYLLYLGYSTWREETAAMSDASATDAPLGRVFWQGLLLAAINPKTLIFSAAFLPQFVSSGAEGGLVLLMPAVIYLSVIFLGDMCWVISARAARPLLRRLGRWRNRLTGTLFLGAGIGLALARIER